MKKTFSILMILMVTFACLPIGDIAYAAGSSVPSVGVSAPSVSTVKQGGTVSYTVYFVNASAINLKSTDIGIAGDGVTMTKTVTGTGNTRTVTLSNIQGPKDKLVSIAIRSGVATNENGKSAQTPKSIAFRIVDDGGSTPTPDPEPNPNPNPNPDPTPSVDKTRPYISITAPQPASILSGGTVKYVVSYTDNVGIQKVDLKASDITLYGFTANIQISGTGNTRTVTLTNIVSTSNTKKYIGVAAGTAWDAAGNKALGIPKSESFVISTSTDKDDTRPYISISAPNPNKIYAGETVRYVISYTDNVGIAGIDLKASDITLNGFTANIEITGTGNERTVILSNIQGEIGKGKYIEVAAGTAWDVAGNKTLGIPKSESFEIANKMDDNKPDDNKPDDNKPSDWVPNPNTGR